MLIPGATALVIAAVFGRQQPGPGPLGPAGSILRDSTLGLSEVWNLHALPSNLYYLFIFRYNRVTSHTTWLYQNRRKGGNPS